MDRNAPEMPMSQISAGTCFAKRSNIHKAAVSEIVCFTAAKPNTVYQTLQFALGDMARWVKNCFFSVSSYEQTNRHGNG